MGPSVGLRPFGHLGVFTLFEPEEHGRDRAIRTRRSRHGSWSRLFPIPTFLLGVEFERRNPTQPGVSQSTTLTTKKTPKTNADLRELASGDAACLVGPKSRETARMFQDIPPRLRNLVRSHGHARGSHAVLSLLLPNVANNVRRYCKGHTILICNFDARSGLADTRIDLMNDILHRNRVSN
jgi:hypothetical protein